MIEFIKKVIAFIGCLIKVLFGGSDDKDPEPPTPAPPLPKFIDEMRRQHPDKTDEELSKRVVLKALRSGIYKIPLYANGEFKRNPLGNIITVPYKGATGFVKDESVEVYRWAFQVDGYNAREAFVEQHKMVDIKDFSKPG